MIERQLTAGSEIESGCTRCKAVLNHTIIAMVEGRVVRVKCNTCGSEHNYRPEKAKSDGIRRSTAVGGTPQARTKTKKDPAEGAREEWERLFHTKDTAHAIPYDMSGSFKVDDLVDHPAFGFGIVRSRHENKMEVLFNIGIKLLRCR